MSFYGQNILAIPDQVITSDVGNYTIPKGYYGYLQMSTYSSTHRGVEEKDGGDDPRNNQLRGAAAGSASSSTNSGHQWLPEGTEISVLKSSPIAAVRINGQNACISRSITVSTSDDVGSGSRGFRTQSTVIDAVWTLSLFKIHQQRV